MSTLRNSPSRITNIGHDPPICPKLGILSYSLLTATSSTVEQGTNQPKSPIPIECTDGGRPCPIPEVNVEAVLPVDRNTPCAGSGPLPSSTYIVRQANEGMPSVLNTSTHQAVSENFSVGPQAFNNVLSVSTHTPKRLQGFRVSTRTAYAFTIEIELNHSKTAPALLDSGTTADFIDARLVTELKLQEFKLGTAGVISLASVGVKITVSTEMTLDVNINGVKTRRGFFVYPQLTERIVLGTPFMIDYAEFLDLSSQSFNGLPLNKRQPSFLSGSKNFSILHIDSTRLQRHSKSRENKVFTLLFKTIEYQPGVSPNTVDPKLFNLADFADVVTDHLPEGLPPKGTIQHSIDVIPGHEAPHKSPCRLSLQHKKELTEQIDFHFPANRQANEKSCRK